MRTSPVPLVHVLYGLRGLWGTNASVPAFRGAATGIFYSGGFRPRLHGPPVSVQGSALHPPVPAAPPGPPLALLPFILRQGFPTVFGGNSQCSWLR